MLTYTAIATGGVVNTQQTFDVFDDGPGVEVLDKAAVVGTGSGVGELQAAAVGGYAGWLLAIALGLTFAVGYYVDWNGGKHDAPFTFTAQTGTVRENGRVYTGVALSTTTSVRPGTATYVGDTSYGVWYAADDATASL